MRVDAASLSHETRQPLGEDATLLCVAALAFHPILQLDETLRFLDSETPIQQDIDEQVFVLVHGDTPRYLSVPKVGVLRRPASPRPHGRTSSTG